MPTGHASQHAPHRLEAWGRSFASLVALEQGRYDGPDRARVRRAVGVAAGLAVDRADVQAGAAADAVKRLLELRAEQLRASVVHQDEVELLRPVQLARLAAAP